MAAPATGSHLIPRGAWARRPSRFVGRRNEVLTGGTMDARRRRLIVDGLAAAGIGYVLVAAFVGFLFVGAAAAGYAGVLMLMALIGNPLSTGVIVLASLLAVAGIATYLVLSHRGAVGRIRAAQQARLGRVE